jgi:hypothetical protein
MLKRPGTVAKRPLYMINDPCRNLLTVGDKYAPIQEWFTVSNENAQPEKAHGI